MAKRKKQSYPRNGITVSEARNACEMMGDERVIWRQHGFQSGTDVAKKWGVYKTDVKRMLDIHGFCNSRSKRKVSISARSIFEDANYHSLNKAIQELRCGEGVF